jgi:hypothetical protein
VVPLIESEGVPCIEVRIGNKPSLLFAIDTGNVNSTIDVAKAREAGAQLTAFTQSVPAGWMRAIVPILQIGALTLTDFHALAMNMVPRELPGGISGTLAYTAFKDRILQIDFVAHRVRISNVVAGMLQMPVPSAKIALVTFGKEGPPIVVAFGFEMEGQKVSAQIDTLFTGSLLIYTASIEKLGLSSRAKTSVSEYFPFTDGGVNMAASQAKLESFDGTTLQGIGSKVYFPTQGVHQPDGLFDGTVGMSLLKNTILTLDFHNQRISVSKTAK